MMVTWKHIEDAGRLIVVAITVCIIEAIILGIATVLFQS